MEILIFEVTGQVIESRSQKPLPDLKIEAWDKDVKYNDLLGQTFTDGEGRFILTFDSTYFREHSPDPRPDLLFKVFLGKRSLKIVGDEVMNNVGLKTEVTLKVEIPEMRPEGRDRVSPAKALKVAEFLQQSDFRGLYGQVREKAGASFGFISDMLVNTVTKMDLTPIKVGENRNENVVGQDVASASTHLQSQQIEVNEVKQYDPKLNVRSFSEMSRRPVNLKAGQKVDLYEENGKVRYYAVTKESKDASEPAQVKTDEVVKLREELKKTRQEAAAKEEKINKLQLEMESLRKDQSEIRTLLKSEAFTKMIRETKIIKKDPGKKPK